jgi:hypothetical protein
MNTTYTAPRRLPKRPEGGEWPRVIESVETGRGTFWTLHYWGGYEVRSHNLAGIDKHITPPILALYLRTTDRYPGY